jgi:hypothetical protein
MAERMAGIGFYFSSILNPLYLMTRINYYVYLLGSLTDFDDISFTTLL